MLANGLRLRLTKTQYIWLGRRQQFAKLNLTAIASNFPNNYYCKFSVTVSDLGLRATLEEGLRPTFAPKSLHPLAGRICGYMLDLHHWLHLRQRVMFGIAGLVW